MFAVVKQVLKYMVAAFVLLAIAGGNCRAKDGQTPNGKGAQGQKGTEKVENAEQQKKPKKKKVTVQEHRNTILEFFVEGNDTIYMGNQLPEARVLAWLGKQRGKDWRQYYRLVYNFSKVYPYAVASKDVLAAVDSTLAAEGWKRGKKEKYITEMQKRLFETYEEPMKSMTISQGALLIRLINRETEITPYNIIKEYKNGIAAGFWQGIAKMYNMNLKNPYDPEGDDAETEELVMLWEMGEFGTVYFSLFGEMPVMPEIKEGFWK